MRPIKYQLGKTIVYRGNRYTVHPSALNSSNLSVEIPNIEILGTNKRPKVLTDNEQQIVNNQRQSEINEGENTHPVINAISKGSKYIPGLKNFEVIKSLGGKPPKIKYEIDNPKIKYFNLNQ